MDFHIAFHWFVNSSDDTCSLKFAECHAVEARAPNSG